jgi:hypothetical protein
MIDFGGAGASRPDPRQPPARAIGIGRRPAIRALRTSAASSGPISGGAASRHHHLFARINLQATWRAESTRTRSSRTQISAGYKSDGRPRHFVSFRFDCQVRHHSCAPSHWTPAQPVSAPCHWRARSMSNLFENTTTDRHSCHSIAKQQQLRCVHRADSKVRHCLVPCVRLVLASWQSSTAALATMSAI